MIAHLRPQGDPLWARRLSGACTLVSRSPLASARPLRPPERKDARLPRAKGRPLVTSQSRSHDVLHSDRHVLVRLLRRRQLGNVLWFWILLRLHVLQSQRGYPPRRNHLPAIRRVSPLLGGTHLRRNFAFGGKPGGAPPRSRSSARRRAHPGADGTGSGGPLRPGACPP